MVRDVDFFSSRLGKINGFGDAGDFLGDIVKSKEVKPKTPEPTESTEEPNGNDQTEDDKKTSEATPTEEAEETEGAKEQDGDEGPSKEGDAKSPEV